jgi:hypothetical protein
MRTTSLTSMPGTLASPTRHNRCRKGLAHKSLGRALGCRRSTFHHSGNSALSARAVLPGSCRQYDGCGIAFNSGGASFRGLQQKGWRHPARASFLKGKLAALCMLPPATRSQSLKSVCLVPSCKQSRSCPQRANRSLSPVVYSTSLFWRPPTGLLRNRSLNANCQESQRRICVTMVKSKLIR